MPDQPVPDQPGADLEAMRLEAMPGRRLGLSGSAKADPGADQVIYTLAGCEIEGRIVARMGDGLLLIEPGFFLDSARAREGDWIGGRVVVRKAMVVGNANIRARLN
jgi:hypothetical protein